MRRITMNFRPDGEGNNLLLPADVQVAAKWTITDGTKTVDGGLKPLTEPWWDFEPVPDVSYNVRVDYVNARNEAPLGFSLEGDVVLPGQQVRMGMNFVMGVVP